jgi:hypothetical protein
MDGIERDKCFQINAEFMERMASEALSGKH